MLSNSGPNLPQHSPKIIPVAKSNNATKVVYSKAVGAQGLNFQQYSGSNIQSSPRMINNNHHPHQFSSPDNNNHNYRSPFKNNNVGGGGFGGKHSTDLSVHQHSMNEDISPVIMNPIKNISPATNNNHYNQQPQKQNQLIKDEDHSPNAIPSHQIDLLIQDNTVESNQGRNATEPYNAISEFNAQNPHEQTFGVKKPSIPNYVKPKFDLKQFRLVATDFLMSPLLQNLFAKLWKLMLSYNYERFQLVKHHELLPQLPLRMGIYEHFIPLFRKAMGAMYQTDQYLCCNQQQKQRQLEQSGDYVLFHRFCFDFLSMSGTLLYEITIAQYEFLLRKMFSTLTYYDELRREICFKRFQDIPSGNSFKIEPHASFDSDQIQVPQNIITPELLKDLLTTKWSKRKSQLREQFLQTLAVEQQEQAKIKLQLEQTKIDEEGDAHENHQDGDPQFDSLINLTAIAEKAREEQVKREERKKNRIEKPKLMPFEIEGLSHYREDLNIVLFKDLAEANNQTSPIFDKKGMLPKQIVSHKQSVSPTYNLTPNNRQNAKVDFSSISQNIKKNLQDTYEEKMKTVLMYKQFVALAKNNDESDEENEEEKEAQRQKEEAQRKLNVKRKIPPHKIATPQLIDSSESDDDRNNNHNHFGNNRRGVGTANHTVIEETSEHTRLSFAQNRQNTQETLNSQERQPGSINGGGGTTTNADDNQFVKYVWNKKTKRLEKRDMRQTTNFEKIDRKKFDKFSKVNEKSKILCMQLQENYFNSTLLPAAISGEGDVNFKEIQEEMIYGPNDIKAQTQNKIDISEEGSTKIPSYQRQLINQSVQRSQQPAVNLMNKRRRASAETTGTSPFMQNVKMANEKLALSALSSINPPHQAARSGMNKTQQLDPIEQAQIVEQKLQIIRMALRGDAPLTATAESFNKYSQQQDDYLQTEQGNEDFRTSAAAAAALVFSKNEAFFNNTATTQNSFYPNGGQLTKRPQTLLQTRDLFMRTKLHAMQQTNKKLILSQREQLKTSMLNQTGYSSLGYPLVHLPAPGATGYSFHVADIHHHHFQNSDNNQFALPTLEATQARLYKHPANLIPISKNTQRNTKRNGHQSSPVKQRQPQPQQLSTLENGSTGNISVKLKIQQAQPSQSSQKPFPLARSVNKDHGGGGFQSSPRSSNNNLDIIEYGVLTLNEKQIKKQYPEVNQKKKQGNEDEEDPAYTQRESNQGDQVIVTGGDISQDFQKQKTNNDLVEGNGNSLQESINVQPSTHSNNLEIAPRQQTKIPPIVSPLNLSALNQQQRESVESKKQPQKPPAQSVDQTTAQKYREQNTSPSQLQQIKNSRSPFENHLSQGHNNNQDLGNDPLMSAMIPQQKYTAKTNGRWGQQNTSMGFTNGSGFGIVPQNQQQAMRMTKYTTSGGGSVMSSNFNSTMYAGAGGKKKAVINQLPMQDFHLEQWRNAYKNINSATRHFYTGSSFPAVAKI